LKDAARRYPSFFGLRIAFDEALARKVYAGSDMFLIPSRYEPCGLTQMYSLKYGTVPIVRATGGLDDTVQEYDAVRSAGNGFKFDAPEAGSLLGAVRKATAAFAQKASWTKIVRNGMACDFSWERAASSYLALYQEIQGLRRV
jgi:starch synthase